MVAKRKLGVVSAPEEVSDDPCTQTWETAHETKARKLTWLLPGRLVENAVNILEGEKGVSKSTFSALLAGIITGGKTALGAKKRKPSCVIWLPGEEDVGLTVRPRLLAAGADLKRVIFPPTNSAGVRWRPTFPGDLEVLREQIQRHGAQLVIIDPISSYVPSQCNLKDDQVIHEVLDPFADVASVEGCTILLNRNLTKNKYASRLDRGQGGAAVAGVARSVVCIDWPDRTQPRRILRVVACNNSPNTPPVEYCLESEGEVGVIRKFTVLDPADDALNLGDDDDAERDVREDARLLLSKLLANGPVEASVIIAEAVSIQVSPRTLRTAKKELGVTSHRKVVGKKARWEWKLPPKQEAKKKRG